MSKKGDLLEKYAGKAVTPFWEYDCFAGEDAAGEGDETRCGQTWELMCGSNVRVLLSRHTSQAVAIRLMGKIIKHMEEHFPKEKYVMNKGLVWEDNERQSSDLPF